MQIEVLFFEGCPSHEATIELVRETLDRLDIEASVIEIDVQTDEEAERRAFLGSPSVRVDGEDIEPGAGSSGSYGRRCRVYATAEGLRGVPPARMLEATLIGESYQSVETACSPEPDCCASSGPAKVQLLVADWCPQCPAAKTFWSELQQREGFELEVVDVESARGSKLAAEHGIRGVPATLIDGSVEFRGTPVPDQGEARRILRRSSGAPKV